MPKRLSGSNKPGLVPGFFLILAVAACGEAPPPAADARTEAGRPARLTIPGTLEDGDIDEASGIAVSARTSGLLWIHEDSGAKARIYAIDERGRSRGRIKLEKADNDDWEDIAAFQLAGEPMLLVADTGDNDAKRKRVNLYLVPEPDLGTDDKPELKPLRRIDFRYPDGPRDAEAVTVDANAMRALVLTKRDLPPRLYAVPLDDAGDGTIEAEFLMAVSTLPRPGGRDVEFAPKTGDWHWQPTAMDLARDGSALAILTYSAVYLYFRQDGEAWPEPLAREPLRFDLGNVRDAEALALSADARTIFVTVEKKHAPLVRIDLLGEESP